MDWEICLDGRAPTFQPSAVGLEGEPLADVLAHDVPGVAKGLLRGVPGLGGLGGLEDLGDYLLHPGRGEEAPHAAGVQARF